MEKFWIYVAIINVIGFIAYEISYRSMKRNGTEIGKHVGIICFLGGAPGVLVSFFKSDRKPKKENMTALVLSICMSIIWIVAGVLVLIGKKSGLELNIFAFIFKHKPLLIYIIVINVVAFLLYGFDKMMAIKDKRRVSIVTLLTVAGIGGSIGALIGMYAFRHKTKKDYFTVGVPVALVMQVLLLVLLCTIFR